MRGYVANTDYDWFTFLRAIEPPVDDVNFWRPGSETAFRALQPGEPFFFRLKSPYNAIGGFGYFAHFSVLPVSVAWEVYGIANGAPTFEAMRQRLVRFRQRFRMTSDPKENFAIGCVLITEPVFFPEHGWVADAEGWAPNVVQGKTFDLSDGEGSRIWLQALGRSARRASGPSIIADLPIGSGYGPAMSVRPRLGQRSFRIAVLDSYARKCAVTSERTLPALEAAHIRDYRDVEEHTISNGILFRADIHKLFDAGYVTVTPDYYFEVSHRIKEEFENGRDYYKLHGTEIRLPANPAHKPLADALTWHNEQRFRG
jgi:putative restriction endonuclease